MTAEALLARYGLAAVFLGAGFEGETVAVAGGLLAHQGYWPLWAAMLAAGVGSFAADQLFFLAGRRFRNHRWVKRAHLQPAFARALAAFDRHPVGFIFAFRFLYGLRTVSPIAIGTTQVPARLFLSVNAASAAVWGLLFPAIGYVFGRAFERLVGRVGAHWQWLVAAGVAVALAGLGWSRWRRRAA